MVVATAVERACVQAPLGDLRHPRRILASLTSTFTGWIGQHGAYAVFAIMAVDALLPVGGELSMLVAGAVGAGAIAGLYPVLLGHGPAHGPAGLRRGDARRFGVLVLRVRGRGLGARLGPRLGSSCVRLRHVVAVAVVLAVLLAGGALHRRRVRA